MSEGVNGCRVAEIVGRNVHGLNGGDRAIARVADAFFQVSELSSKGRLITQSRWELASESRNLRAGLNEAKDVIDEQQHVLARVVAEILSHGQGAVADS